MKLPEDGTRTRRKLQEVGIRTLSVLGSEHGLDTLK